jgi:hypothetical protein
MNNKILYTILLGVAIPLSGALAICPVCTLAVGMGVGLSRWLGIEDSITGLWIGGLIVSLITWTISWLSSKKIKIKWLLNILIFIGYYLLIIIPLDINNIINIDEIIKNKKIDDLFLSIIIGSIIFYLGTKWYFYLKEKNNNHAHFPFQKVIMPIIPLIILSIIFYLI